MRALCAALLMVCLGGPLAQATSPKASVCRVYNHVGGVASVGSGTLIDRTAEGREGLVLTCWHLFREGTGQVVVKFADGRTHAAKLVAVDAEADLAALAIAKPQAEATQVNLTATAGRLSACGFGQTGDLRCAVGIHVDTSQSPGQTSLLIDSPVRSGDSGGGVFNAAGELVAVVWGEREGVTYASGGAPLQRFLERVLGRRTGFVVNCPGGVCTQPQPPSRLIENDLVAAIEELRRTKQDRGDYVTRNELANFDQQQASLLEQVRVIAAGGSPSVGRAAGGAIAALLGLSGPAGWAALAAGTVGGWLVGRRMKRKLDGAGGRRRPFRSE